VSTALNFAQAADRKRRQDVIRWARECGFRPQMSIEAPDAIVAFIGRCIELHADQFTHAHGSEIFRWCKESASCDDCQPPSGPEAA